MFGAVHHAQNPGAMTSDPHHWLCAIPLPVCHAPSVYMSFESNSTRLSIFIALSLSFSLHFSPLGSSILIVSWKRDRGIKFVGNPIKILSSLMHPLLVFDSHPLFLGNYQNLLSSWYIHVYLFLLPYTSRMNLLQAHAVAVVGTPPICQMLRPR